MVGRSYGSFSGSEAIETLFGALAGFLVRCVRGEDFFYKIPELGVVFVEEDYQTAGARVEGAGDVFYGLEDDLADALVVDWGLGGERVDAAAFADGVKEG